MTQINLITSSCEDEVRGNGLELEKINGSTLTKKLSWLRFDLSKKNTCSDTMHNKVDVRFYHDKLVVYIIASSLQCATFTLFNKTVTDV